MNKTSDNRFMKIEEVADVLAVCQRTVRRKIRSGDLPGHKFKRSWRIARADFDAFLQRHRSA